MKLPRVVTIVGLEYKVIADKDKTGGWFNTGAKEIHIGTKIKSDIKRIFVHEVLEAILTERGNRYTLYGNGTNDRLLFSFYHYEYEQIVDELVYSLKSLIKE